VDEVEKMMLLDRRDTWWRRDSLIDDLYISALIHELELNTEHANKDKKQHFMT